MNLNSALSTAVVPRCLSCQSLANQHKPETRFNVTNMFKTRERRSDFMHYANLMRFSTGTFFGLYSLFLTNSLTVVIDFEFEYELHLLFQFLTEG